MRSPAPHHRHLATAVLALVVAMLAAAVPAFATAPPNGLSRAEARAASRVLGAAERRGVSELPGSPFLRRTACGRAVLPVRRSAARHRAGLVMLRRAQRARSRTAVRSAVRRVRVARVALRAAVARRTRLCAPRRRTSVVPDGEDAALRGSVVQERPRSVVSGSARVLALPVDFRDRPARRAFNAPRRYDQLLFGDDYPHGGGSLADYYREVSHGSFSVDGDVAPWRRMSRTRASYAADSAGMGAYPRNSQGLLEDAVRANDRGIDFGDYDNDGPDGRPNSGDDDGFVDAVFVIFAGTSAAENGNLDTLWPHAWQHQVATRDRSASGGMIRVGRYAAVPERMEHQGPDGDLLTVGVVAHEYGHILGLPDLVDGEHGDGAGRWDLMGSGMWGFEHSSRPSGLSAWSRARLGWLTPTLLEGDHPGHKLESLTTSRSAVKLPIAGEPLHEHYLVERRTRSGFDADLPGDGLLVWHVDDSISSTDGAHPRVELVAADGSADGDARDMLTPGGFLSDSTSPDLRAHDGSDSLVLIQNVAEAPGRTVDLHAGKASLAPVIDAKIDRAGPQAAAPTAVLNSPLEGARVRGTVTMSCTGTGSPNVNRLTFYRDTTSTNVNVSPSSANATRTYDWNTGTSNGPYALRCRARNTWGQTTDSTTVNVIVDNMDPAAPTISAPTAGAWVRGTVSYTATGTDNYGVTSFSYQVDGVDDWQGPWTELSPKTNTYAWDTTTATNGAHTLTVLAQDLAGNVSVASASRTVNVDNALPTVTMPADGSTLPDIDQQGSNTTLRANWTAGSDLGSGLASYQWRFCASPACTTVVASGSGVGLTATATSLSLAPGTYYSCVRATDVAGNQSLEQCSDGVMVDNVAPSMGMPNDGATAPDQDSQASTTTLGANWAAATDGAGSGVAGYDWRFCTTSACGSILASGSGAATSASASSLALTPGSMYVACVRARDALSNTSAWSCSDGIVVAAPPTVTITAPTTGSGVTGTVAVDATATDPGGGIVQFEYRLDGMLQYTDGPLPSLTPRSATWSWNTTSLPEGSYTIEVTAYDDAGMTDTDAIVVTVDHSNPTSATHGGIASGSYVTGIVNLTSSSADAGGLDRVEYLIDNTAVVTAPAGGATSFTDPGTPFDTAVLLDGNHGYRMRSYDLAGNSLQSTPGTFFVVNNNVEGTPPTGTLTSPAAGGLGASNVTLTASVADDNVVVKVEFLLDGAPITGVAAALTAPGFSGGTVSRTWTNTGDVAAGAHTLSARITDASGNTYVTPGVAVTK